MDKTFPLISDGSSVGVQNGYMWVHLPLPLNVKKIKKYKKIVKNIYFIFFHFIQKLMRIAATIVTAQ